MFVSLSQGQTGQTKPISETNDGVVTVTMLESYNVSLKQGQNEGLKQLSTLTDAEEH